jgi:hypothetical protein
MLVLEQGPVFGLSDLATEMVQNTTRHIPGEVIDAGQNQGSFAKGVALATR